MYKETFTADIVSTLQSGRVEDLAPRLHLAKTACFLCLGSPEDCTLRIPKDVINKWKHL